MKKLVIVICIFAASVAQAGVHEPDLPYKLVWCGMYDLEDRGCHVAARFRDLGSCDVYHLILKQGCAVSEHFVICPENWTPKFRTYCSEE